MRLLQKRIEFSADLALLLSFASSRGLEFVVDQCRRTSREALWNSQHCRVVNAAGARCELDEREHDSDLIEHTFRPIGIRNSLHVSGLAADVYVIREGRIADEKRFYAPLGGFWTNLRPGNCWGGDFVGFQDLGHFSREHDGRK